MKLALDLPADVSIALRRFRARDDDLSLEAAATLAIREYLVGTGDLEFVPGIEEGSETAGSA